MDTDGEELVAIVQGLDAPGVTVTVSNRARHNVERRRPSRSRIQINTVNRTEMSPAADQRLDTMPAIAGIQSVSGMPATQRASVETTTGADFAKISKGSQICDDRYTSSYKLAHCQMTPTSPPEGVSEFPPQRREACRNQGNFEIGGNGSAQWSCHSEQGSGLGLRQAGRSGQVRASTSRIKQNGGSHIWRDKGSSHRYCNSKRDTDAFEHSLRKYPSMAPFRTASNDLIEKLIRYTQAKNFQEMSRSSKSVRSFRHQKSADTDELATKHQQTYTRRQDNNLPSSSGVQVGNVGRTRNFKLYSPVSDSKNLRNREIFSTSYDYLKAGGTADGRSNRSDGSPSPTGSKSPEESRSSAHSPVRFGSPSGSKGPGSPGRSRRPGPIRFERSVRDLSLSEMSKYIRNTVRQICNEKPAVFQVCPKLKNRYNQHKRVCPSKNEQTSDLVENDEEEAQASGSVLSRIIRSFTGWPMPLTEQSGCQCNITDCYCTRATQCGYNPEVSTKTVGCSCRTKTIEANTSCSRDLTCVCARKAQDQAYYNERIDEAITEWLKDVPVHSVECAASKKKRETIIQELRETLKQLPDDEDFDQNVRNEISSFIDDFPLWNPGKDDDDEMMFKNQLADKLIDIIVAIPRRADRFRDIVTKWVENLDFEDDNDEEIEIEVVIDDFVNKLKSLAAERPACDMKYTHILRKEITELLVELPLNYDSAMLKRKAHQLATEIVNLPRNIKLSGDTDSTSVLEENLSEWICEHGLCKELKKDPKLIEGLANKLKSQGMGDEELIETMKELIFEFVDDVETAIGILDEFVDELMKTVPSADQKDDVYSTQQLIGPPPPVISTKSEPKRFNQDEVTDVVTDWLKNLPGAYSYFSPSKFQEISEEIIDLIQDTKPGNEDLENNIFEYVVDTGLPIDLAVLHTHVEDLLEILNCLPPSDDLVEQAKRIMVQEMFKIIDTSSMSEEKQDMLRRSTMELVEKKLPMMSALNFFEDPDDVKEALLEDMSQIFDKLDIPRESQEKLKKRLSSSLSATFDKSFPRLGKDESDLKQTIEKKVRKAVDELPVGLIRKEDLMGQVKKTTCKHMNKPLPPKVKNNINDNICNIVEKCPISEDRSLCGRLKKALFDVVGQHLDMLLPKPVCDFQGQLEKDVSMVIDRCPIDPGNKRQLKKSVQDVFTKNGDRPLSEEVVKTMQDEINCVCSDVPIPKDKKEFLRKAVGASVSENLRDALASLRYDLNRLRKRLYNDTTDVIENSPITRDVKTNLKSQLKSTLVSNLDSSLSDDEMHNILDEVSDILKYDMPEEKRKDLTNKLSNKIDTFQRKEKTKDQAGMITKDVDELINRLSIDSSAMEDVKKDVKAVLQDTLYNPLTKDKQHKIREDIMNEIDKMDIPKHEENDLKSNVADAMTKELNKLIAQGKEVPEIKTALEETIGNEIKDSPIPKDKQELLDHKIHGVLADNLIRDVTNDDKEAVREKLSDIVDDLKMDKGKSKALKTQLLKDADKYFEKCAQDKMQTDAAVDENLSDYQRDSKAQNKILRGLEKSIDDASIPKEKKIELKNKLKNIAAKNLKKALSGDATELTKSGLKELENKTKKNILQGLETAVDEAPIPKEKKTELEKKLKDLTTQHFKSQLSDDVPVALKGDMNEIVDEMNLPKDKKDKLKSELTATVDDNMRNLQSKTKPSQRGVDDVNALEKETKANIIRGLEHGIDEAPIPKEKKMELKKKLKDLTTQQFKSPLSDDFAVVLKDDMDEIIDEMNLPKDKKDKLKSEMTATVDDNMSNLRSKTKPSQKRVDFVKALEKKTKANIVWGLEHGIDDAPIPKEKKLELKKKLKDLTTRQFKSPLSDDVAAELKDEMDEIIDEMNLPKDKKNLLKSDLYATLDENMGDMKRKIKDADSNVSTPKSKELEKEIQVNIERELESVIDTAPIPKEKKMELKKKLKELMAQYFKHQLSDDVPEALKDDMNQIIDDMNLPKDKKDKLKSDITATVDDNMSNLRSKTKPSQKAVDDVKALEKVTKTNIVRGLEQGIDEAPIPKEKKMELKKKVKDLTTQQFKSPLSDDVAVVLKDDMEEIIDDMNLPKDKKDKLKSDMTATVDDNMSNLRSKTKPSQKGVDDVKALEKETKANIVRGLEHGIDEAPIPKEKKMELKKKVKDLTTQQFKSPLSDDVAVVLKDDMDEIIDEMNLPKDKKDKLKNDITATVDDNMSNLRSKTKPSQKRVDDVKALEKETKANIVRGLEHGIDVAPIPKEKKVELKKKVKDLTTQQFKSPLSDDVAVVLKDDMDEIIDEMNLPKDKKNRLKSDLNATLDENMGDMQRKIKDVDSNFSKTRPKELEKETKGNIVRGLENVINEAPIPTEKKQELKKNVKELTAQHFKNQLSDDVPVALKDDMNEIIDEMNLPKDKKDKLKSDITATVDDNMSNLRSKTKPSQKGIDDVKALEKETKANIVRGLEHGIDDAPIPKEKKIELKKKLKDLTTQQFKSPLSDDVAVALKDDMDEIIEEMNLPKDKKSRLKRDLNATLDENMGDLQKKVKDADSNVSKPKSKELEKEIQENIERELENVIDTAPIPKEKKQELKKKLKELMAQYFKHQLSDDVPEALKDDMNQIIDEMNLPKDKKDKLKSDITATVDDNMSNLRSKPKPSQKGVDDVKALEKETKANIVRGLEHSIDEAPIPKEKKMELKKKVKDLTTQQFKSPITDDVAVVLKDDMDEIIDKMNLPKDKKDKLKSDMTATVDDNMSNLRSKTKPSQKGVDDVKALEKETKANIVRGLEHGIDEAPIPKEKKMELKKKVKDLTTQQFKSPLSDDVAVVLKDDMDEIIDEMNLPKDKKDKLKSEMTATVDDNMSNLRSKTKPSQKGVDDVKALQKETKANIVRGLEHGIDEAPIPKEKKIELKKKVKDLTTQQFKSPLSDDVAVVLKDDMDEIIDEMNLPKDKKDKLKSDMTATVDENMSNLRSKTKPSQKGVDDVKALEKETKANIVRGLEHGIDEAPIPKEKKMELKKKVKDLTTQQFKSPLSDDVAVVLKDDMDEIIDEMNLPKDKKDKLKSDMTATVDDNMSNLQSKTKPSQKGVDDVKALEKETKANIVRGLEHGIDEAPIPKEKKIELKKKVKDLTTQQFKSPLSHDVAVVLKDDMDEIIDEMNLPKDKKDKLKSDMTATVDDNMSNLRSKTKPSQKGVDDVKALEKETKANIVRGLEHGIDEAPIPKEKKMELKKKVKDLTSQQFKSPLSDDVAVVLKDDMDEIIDEMNLPKDKKNRLKSDLNATLDENMRDMQRKIKDADSKFFKPISKELEREIQVGIERELENVIDAAPIPKEKKQELKKKLKDLMAQYFKHQLSDDVPEALKDDMNQIIDDMNLPKDKKDKLKSDITATVDDNMSNLRSKTKPSQKRVDDVKALEKETKANIVRGLEHGIDEAPIPKEKKIELKKKVKDLTTQQFKSPLSDDVAVELKDDMDEIIDEMNLPKEKKDKLKSELTATVDDNMSNLRSKTKPSQKAVDVKALEKETKANIVRGLEHGIDEAPIPKEKKMELKKKLKDLTTQQFKSPLSDDVAVVLKDDMDEIIDEMNLPKDKKNRLKSDLNATLDKNMSDMQRKIKDTDSNISKPKSKELEKEIQVHIERELENVIDAAPIPKEKKMELKKKVKELMAQYFKHQLSDDVPEALKDDMNQIIDDMNLPKDKKDKLKSDITATVDDNMSNLRSKTKPSQKAVDDVKALEKVTKTNIVRGLEQGIDEAPIPKEKKMELKKKVKDLTTQQFKSPLSDDVAVVLKDDMEEIIDDMNLPKDKKDKLKSDMTATVDDNMSNLRSKTKPSQKGVDDVKALEKETKANIVRGLEHGIDEAPIPKEKKMELKKKVKDLTTQQFKSPLSDEVAVVLKDDMDEIIDEMILPKDKKDKLKSDMTATVDDNMSNLRSKTKPSQKGVDDVKALEKETKASIVRGLEHGIDEAPIPKEKKMELKKKVKDLTTQQFKSPLSDDVAVVLKDDMDEIIDEMNLPKDKKDKLKSEMTATVDDNMSNLRSKTKPSQKGVDDVKALEKETKANIVRGLEYGIDEAPIPKEKKMELKKKVKDLTTHQFKSPLSDDVAVVLKDDMDEIIDEMNLPKDKKDKLKRDMTATVDDNMSNLRSKTKPSQKAVDDVKALEKETKASIVRGLEHGIDEAPIPKEKKMELKKKVKDLTTQQFKSPLSDDVAVVLKDDMDEIIDEMNLPKDKKDKLKSEMTATVDDNMSNLRSKTKPSQKGVDDVKALEKETKANIVRGLEYGIDEAPIPKEKKMELKKKVKDLTTHQFKSPLSDDVAVVLKDDMDEIIDEMNLPKDKKDKLKRDMTATVDDNMSNLRSKTKPSQKAVDDVKALEKETKANIVRGLEHGIDEAPIPKEKKMELKKKVKDLTTQQFKSPLSDDVAVVLKDDMDEIIDEMNLPKDKKDKLKSDMTATVDDNMSNLRSKTKPSQKKVDDVKALEKETKANIIRGLEHGIDEAPIPKEKKVELKKKVKDLTTQQFKSPLSDDVAVVLKDDMDEIIDEMNLPKDKKDKLKSDMTATVDDNMSNLRWKTKPSQKRVDGVKALEKETKANIVRGLEHGIDEAPIPKENKMELKKKVKDLTTQQFKSPLSDDVAAVLKDDMDEIIDEMNLPKDKKNRLKSDLNATLDENMSDMQRKIKDVDSKYSKPKSKELDKEIQLNIERELDNVIDAAPLPKEKKQELSKKLKDLMAQYFKNQFTDDIPVALKDDMNEIIDEMNLPKDKKDKLKSELTATLDENVSHLKEEDMLRRPQMNWDNGKKMMMMMSDLKDSKYAQVKSNEKRAELENETKLEIAQDLEKVIEDAPLPKEKKLEIKKNLKDLSAKHFKKHLSDDVVDTLKDDINKIADGVNLPKDKKDELKDELAATVDENMRNLQKKIKDDDSQTKRRPGLLPIEETKKKDRILQGIEKVIEKSAIPENKKRKLSGVLQRMASDNLKKRLSDDVQVKGSTQVDDFNYLKKKTKSDILIGNEKAVARAKVPKELRNYLKKKLQELTKVHFMRPLTDNTAQGIKDDINKVIDNLNIPKESKDLLKIELAETVDENMRNLLKRLEEMNRKPEPIRKKKQEKKIDDGLKDIFDKYGIDPRYANQLAEEFNKLLEIAREGGDLEDARRKLIEKLMRDLNLTEEEATALADELIGKARKTALKEQNKDLFDKYGIDPNYADQLTEEFNKLLKIARKFGDFEEPRKKLIKKLMRDVNLPEQEASDLADEMIDRAQKMALKEHIRDIFDEYGIDPSYEDQLAEEFNKLLKIARKFGDFEEPRKKLIKKLMRDLNLPEEEASAITDELIDRARKIALKEHLRDIFDKYEIDPSDEDKLVEEFKKLLEIAHQGGDLEDARNKLIKKLMRDLNLPEEEASALGDELIDRARKMALKEEIRDLFDKYGMDPSYEDQLAEEFNKLLNIARKFGDFEEPRKKLIKKLMRDLNLPEEEASAITDELIDRARKIALKEYLRDIFDKYEIEPSDEDKIVEEFNKLLEIARQGGDFEDARNKLIKKLMRDLNLPEEEASALGDELIDRARKMALKEEIRDLFDKYGMDPSYEDQLAEEFNKLLNIARKFGDFEEPRKKLIKKLMRDLNLPEEEASAITDELIDRARKIALKEYLRDIFDKYEIEPSDEDKIVEEFNKLLEIARQGGDFEDARNKLIKKLMRDLNLPEEEASALGDELIDRARKMALKEQIRDLFDKYGTDPSYEDQLAEEFNKLLEIARKGGDFEDARKKLIKKLMRDLNLSEEEASALADEMIDRARKMALKEQIKDIFDNNEIDPSYEDQLAEEFNKLLNIARKFGDFEDPRKKLIEKLMRDLNLPEEEASALADQLIDRAQKIALKEYLRDIFDKYGIDPSDEDDIVEEFKKLLEIARNGGDFEDARKELIKKLMRDLNLPEEEASALADELIARAKEMALVGKTTDAFAQAISDAVDESTVAKAEKPILKNKLLSKLKQILDKKPFIHKDDIGPLKEEILKGCNEIVDESTIPTDKKTELKLLLEEKLDMALEEDEDREAENLEDYKDIITKSIKKWMKSLPIHLEPKVAATVADNIAGDVVDRHKYLHAHPEAKHSEKDEIENLKYQVFRRMHRVVNPKAIPKIMERTPDLYKTIMKIKPPPLEPIRAPKPKDAFAKADSAAVDEDPLAQKKMKELKKVFAKSVDEAIVDSSLSKPDKKSLKKKLLEDLGITADDESPQKAKTKDRKKAVKYDVGPSDAMDKSPAAMEYKKKIRECVKTWLETLPIELDPKTADVIADNLTDDILERQKYLRTHLEATTDEDEIENLMYQVFRRLKDIVEPEGIPDIMKRTEDLYNMIMNIKKQKESQERGTSSKRRRNPSPHDRKKNTIAALSTGNIHHSLRELIASTKGVRKQWSRNLDAVITKLPSLKTDKNVEDKLAIYDETGQIDMLSTTSRSIPGFSTYQRPTSKKQIVPKQVPKNKGKSRLSKIEEAFAFNNTTKQKSPFNTKQNQITEKEYVKTLNDIIKNWIGKVKVNIAPNEKNKIIDELVRDMVERQKYIQEYEIPTASQSDELEYLKLQVHRRLNPVVPSGTLKTIVEDVGELGEKIKNVQIPKMVAEKIENVETPQTVAATNANENVPPKIPPKSPKSSIKSPVSKKKKSKQRTSIQTTPSNEAETSTEEVPQTVDDDAVEREMSNTEFSPGQASTPTKTVGEEYMDKVTESIKTWIESVPINLEPEVQAEVINDLANDIVDRQKYLQVHPEKMISKREEIENLRFHVFKRLDKVTDDESLIPDIDKVEELYKIINGDGRRKNLTPKEAQEFQTTLPDEIAAILNDYNICCERRELLSSLTKELAKLANSNADQDEIIENLIDDIKRITYLSNCDMCDDEAEDLAYKLLARTKKLIARIQSKGAPVKRRDFREAMMNDIGDVFRGCPMSEDKRRLMECQLAEDYANDLGIPLQDSEVTMTGAGHYGMSFNGLSNFIDSWLSSIHTEDDDEGESETNDMKKDMAYNLIHKIGEMNVDPEIFNDDALYEAVLRDELQNMLGDITIPDEDIDALKEDLITKVLEAKQRAHDEFAGQAYKRNLRDTISKVLPDQRNLSKEEQATMKTLKDQLADAYIDLHFSGNDESQREKLKKKIANELSRFCQDYMNNVPCAPLSSQKLNQDLYAALNAVPLPAKDSIRYEVEQARIREEINDWLKELPIQPQNPTELLARNKMVYVLAKKLFDIEIEGNDTENDSKRGEIVKFLNKLPLETEEDMETLADILIDKLKETEESRKYNPSSNVTIDSFGNISMDAQVCPKHKSLFEKQKTSPGPSDSQIVCGRPTCKQSKPMPLCTLSPEDKDYLERIRRRTYLSPSCVRSIMKDNKPKICPGLRPVDVGSQTMLRPNGYQRPRSPICRIAGERTPRPGSGQPANAYSQHRRDPFGKDKPQRAPVCPVSQQKIAGPCPGPSSQCSRQMRRHMISSTNISDGNEEAQPPLTIKKYYWNNDKNSVEESEIPQNARGNRGDPSLSHQSSPTQCNKIRISTGAQCSPPPCHRSSLGKLRQQDTGPQRVPYDFSTHPAPCPAPYPDPKSQRQPSSSSYGDQQRSFQPPCSPSPCVSPFRINNQPSPPSSAFSKRDNECRIPKRDGLDHPEQMPCSSSRVFRKERVIELGSLDNLCNARPKKRHNDANDWHFEEEEEDNFWTSPIRRVILDEGIDDSVVMEREQREERIRCKCKERLVPKFQAGRTQLGDCPSQQFTQGNEGGQNLKKCAKCCGRRCPYPSYFYFRQ